MSDEQQQQQQQQQSARNEGMGASAGWFKNGGNYNFAHRHEDRMKVEQDKHEQSMKHYQERFQSVSKSTHPGASPGVFDKDGAIGKHFTESGAIGGAASKLGGPLAADGRIGKKFTDKGSIGGSVQSALGDSK